MRSYWIRVVVVLLVLVAAPVALAKGPPDKLVLSGPGIAEPVEITEAALLADLGMGGLENFSVRLMTEPQVSDGYRLDRFFRQGAAYLPFDRVVYYPPRAGERGVVFYAGLSAVSSGWSEYDGKWFQATPAGDRAMQQLLNQYMSPGTLPATGSPAAVLPPAAIVAFVLLLLGAGGAILVAHWRRQRDHARPASLE